MIVLKVLKENKVNIMTEHEKEVLNQLSKEQLIYLIEWLSNIQSMVEEICVEESKCHIDSDKAVDKIRDYIYQMPSLYDAEELMAYIDMKMNKISIKEYRRMIGLED